MLKTNNWIVHSIHLPFALDSLFYEALLRLGSSRCCQRYMVRGSDRGYWDDDIDRGHHPLKIDADDHIDDVPNFFNYILVKKKKHLL